MKLLIGAYHAEQISLPERFIRGSVVCLVPVSSRDGMDTLMRAELSKGSMDNGESMLLRNVGAVLGHFRSISPTMSLQAAQTLLLVAANPGASVSELAEAADCKLPQMSRNLSDMGSHNRKGEPGLGLVETIVDEQEHRRKHALLTAQGQEVVKRLVGLLNGQEATTPRG